MPLVPKFASAWLLDEVRKDAIEHPWLCAMEQPVVSYFVRVLPEANGKGRACSIRQWLIVLTADFSTFC